MSPKTRPEDVGRFDLAGVDLGGAAGDHGLHGSVGRGGAVPLMDRAGVD